MAISKITFEEDEAIKRMASAQEAPSRFKWDESLNGDGSTDADLRLRSNDGERDIALGDIANTVGNALANLMMSKGEKDVFTSENRDFVAKVARTVGERFQGNELGQAEDSRLSETDLHRGIERVLIENNAHDVARSLVIDTARNVAQSDEKISVRLIRRNSQVVSWNENKIEIAIRKAFLSQQKDSAPAVLVAQSVTERVRDAGQAFIHIEEVQDVVQEELMKAGHYKVAEAYILYRSQRSLQRTDELVTSESEAGPADATQQELLLITQPDGSSLFWKGEDLLERIKYASIDLDLCLNEEQIEAVLRRSLFSEMSAAELQTTILLNAKVLMERDADFARFAGRLLCTYIYEEVLDWDILRDGVGALKEAHARYLPEYLRHGVEIKRLSPDLLQYDTGKLGAALDPSADLEFDYLGIQTLYDRYLIVDRTNTGDEERRIETPQLFWMRVAMGLFHNEVDNKEERVVSLYNLYKNRRFCSSTPTLFNSGTPHSQLSSCYLYWVDDSIEGIMERGITENAYLSKWAGGLGGSWTSVRGMGGHIRGTNGRSQGVIPFLKLHNDLLVAVNQGGKRRGSGCAYLETWHNDIGEFLELRKNTGDDRRRTHDMNTANWVPDLFMKRMEAREDWTLFCSSDAPDLHETYGRDFEERYLAYEAKAERGEMSGEKIPAIDLWKRMLQMIFETGHPWITFKDACNVRSPGSRRGHPQFQPLHRDHAQHRQRRDGCLQPGLGRARQSSHRERRTRLGQAEGNNSHRRARAGQRHRHQLLPDATGPEREPAPPADWPRRDGVAKCALPKRRAVCLRGGGGVQRRVHGGDRLFRLRGVQRLGQGKGALRKLRRLQVGSRSAAAGHGRSARAGARPSGGCAARRQDGLGTHPSKNRQPGHAKQQRAGHRADGNHLQYHGHLTVHRAALQESLCEEQLVRRLHRAESPFGQRPQGQGTLERGRDEQAKVSRR